jgi:hypothetical protein
MSQDKFFDNTPVPQTVIPESVTALIPVEQLADSDRTAGAVFSIEYRDGRVIEIHLKSVRAAQRMYKIYSAEAEDDAKAWGWDTKYKTPTLSQQIRSSKAK